MEKIYWIGHKINQINSIYNKLCYGKSIIQLTNNKSWSFDLDPIIFQNETESSLIIRYEAYKTFIFANAINELMEYQFPSNHIALSDGKFEQSSKVDLDLEKKRKLSEVKLVLKPKELSPRTTFRNPNAKKQIPFAFNNYDRHRNIFIPQQLVTNGHIAISRKFSQLPREITQKDEKIKFNYRTVEPMFTRYATSYFDFKLIGKDFKNQPTKKIIRYIKTTWRKEKKVQTKAYDYLKRDLFLNKSALKITNCRYSFLPGSVTIYFDLNSNLFAIVNQESNEFIEGGVASLTDYVDIAYFKWVGIDWKFKKSLTIDPIIEEEEPWTMERNPLPS